MLIKLPNGSLRVVQGDELPLPPSRTDLVTVQLTRHSLFGVPVWITFDAVKTQRCDQGTCQDVYELDVS